MVIFEIDTPTTDQMREILNSIAKKAAIELGLDFDGTLDFDMLRDAEKMPPRTARICIETAIGVAAADGFDHVTRDAWKTAMRAMGRRDSRVSMGFV
jgi:tellurite resistance protein